jgi:hypothetical protein
MNRAPILFVAKIFGALVRLERLSIVAFLEFLIFCHHRSFDESAKLQQTIEMLLRLRLFAQKEASAMSVKTERPSGKKRASKDKEKRDLVESIAKQAINKLMEEKLVAVKKLKTEREEECNEFFADRKLFMAEASAGLKILLRDATMDKVMAKANTPDKVDWQKKQVAIALSEMEARSKQAILEMEKKELETKLDITRLKMELEAIKQGNKENIN